MLFTSQRATFTDPLRAALHGAGAGRHRGSAADPERVARHLLARRPAHRLQPARRALPAVEAVSRRHRLAALALQHARATRSRRSRSRRRARTTPTRCGSATRSTSARTATASSTCSPSTRRASRSGSSRATPTSRCSTASAGGGRIVYEQAGVAAPARSAQPATSEEADDRRRVGPARDAAALRQGRAMDPRRGAVADRRARGVRLPRRDRHRAGREGRRPQPDEQRRRARSLPGVVAGRPIARLVLRRVGRVPALHRQPGRQGRAARDQGRGRGLLQRPGLVAGLAEDRLLRQLADRSTGST